MAYVQCSISDTRDAKSYRSEVNQKLLRLVLYDTQAGNSNLAKSLIVHDESVTVI